MLNMGLASLWETRVLGRRDPLGSLTDARPMPDGARRRGFSDKSFGKGAAGRP